MPKLRGRDPKKLAFANAITISGWPFCSLCNSNKFRISSMIEADNAE